MNGLLYCSAKSSVARTFRRKKIERDFTAHSAKVGATRWGIRFASAPTTCI
jgi:hypothetical protein